MSPPGQPQGGDPREQHEAASASRWSDDASADASTAPETVRQVEAGGLRWQVRSLGSGPVALLLHGTGASAESWRGLMPLLARRYHVVAIDLPGHGGTATPRPSGSSLPGMASLIAALVRSLGLEVELLVGHSAGAAIAVRLVLDGALAPRALVAINGALVPLAGLAGLVFPPVAQFMAATPFAASLFARRRWDRRAVERLIGGTGSRLDARGLAVYGRLVADPSHVAGALAMMAQWDLRPLWQDLVRLQTPLTLIVGTDDRAVPPADARRVRERLPAEARCTIERVDRAGHLAHEERPGEVAERILRASPPVGPYGPRTT